MYRGLRVAVVVPAFNEEQAIATTLERVPAWVDRVFVIDDASRDRTLEVALATAAAGPRFEVIRHPQNRGVGAAIITGYRRAMALEIDVAAVMAGDGQMDPADLPLLIDPLADGHADYAKGNRFRHRDIWKVMPAARLLGNIALSVATKFTSGYRELFDSQCGYTVISTAALQKLDLDRVFPRYGYPNDLLARLNVAGARVVDVPVRPIYGPQWKSGISPATVIYPVSFVLLSSYFSRVASRMRGARKLSVPRKSAEPAEN